MAKKWAARASVSMNRAQTSNGTLGMSHKDRVVFIDNSKEVLKQMNDNADRALNAVGIKAVNLILWQMRQGYGRPIRQTGDLQRDVSFAVHPDEKAVDVGNTLEYAPFVHDGTRKMQARPYISDALTSRENQRTVMRVYEQYLKRGFEK